MNDDGLRRAALDLANAVMVLTGGAIPTSEKQIRPVEIWENMQNVGANNFPVAIGDSEATCSKTTRRSSCRRCDRDTT